MSFSRRFVEVDDDGNDIIDEDMIKDNDGIGEMDAGMTDSSDDDSDDDSDDSTTQHTVNHEEIEHMEIKLRQDPYNFDKNVEFVNALRKAGLKDRLREARKNMQAIFPLPETNWIQWLMDEQNASQLTESETIELFEKAILDGLSVNIWICYCKYIEGLVISSERISKYDDPKLKRVRDIYEMALEKCACHVSEVSKLWSSYRTFEQIVMSMVDETDTPSQVSKIRTLYQRQLSYPQLGLQDIFQDYLLWEETQTPPYDVESDTSLQEKYKESVKLLSERQELETKVQPNAPELTIDTWKEYISLEKKTKSVERVIAVYERALKSYYYSFDLWRGYLIYIEHEYKDDIDTQLFKRLERASRNIYWSGEFWVFYLNRIEKYHCNAKQAANLELNLEYEQVFERALVSGLQSALDYQKVFNTKFEYMWRLYRGEKNIQLYKQQFRDLFEREIQYNTAVNGDSSETLLFWARFEANHLMDFKEAKNRFQQLLQVNKVQYHVWQEYIRFLISSEGAQSYGEVRKLYHQAVKAITESSRIWLDWIEFERLYGDLATLQEATRQYDEVIRRYMTKQSEYEKQKEAEAKNRQEKLKTQQDKKRKDRDGVHSNGHGSNETDKLKKQKKDHNQDTTTPTTTTSIPASTTPKDTLYISNLPFKITEEELKSLFPNSGIKEIHLIYDRHGKSKGNAFILFKDDVSAKNAILEINTTTLQGFKLRAAISNKPFLGGSGHQNQNPTTTTTQSDTPINFDNTEGKTVFINNLSQTVTKEKLEEFFKKNGIECTDIRVIMKPGGRPFAYADLSSHEQLKKMLTMDQKYFLGKSMNVYVSKPPGGGNKKPIGGEDTTTTSNTSNGTTTTTTTNNTKDETVFRKPTLLIPRGLKPVKK